MKTPKILKVSEETEICFFKSDINYTILHLKNGQKHVSGYNLKVFEEIYKDGFIKANRSDLINVKFIKNLYYSKNTCTLQLNNGNTVNVSRRRIQNLKKEYPSLF